MKSRLREMAHLRSSSRSDRRPADDQPNGSKAIPEPSIRAVEAVEPESRKVYPVDLYPSSYVAGVILPGEKGQWYPHMRGGHSAGDAFTPVARPANGSRCRCPPATTSPRAVWEW